MFRNILIYSSALTVIRATGEFYDEKFPKYPTPIEFSKTTTVEPVSVYIKWITGSPDFNTATKDTFGQDFMINSDKKIVCNMIHELLVQATNYKIQARNVRDQHKPAMAFEVGLVIGVIRENYRRMLEVYRELMTQESKFGKAPDSTIWPQWAHRDDVRPIYYFSIYEFIRELQWGITALVELLEKIPPEEMHMPPSTIMPYRKPTPRLPHDTTGNESLTTTTTKPTLEPDDYDYDIVSDVEKETRKRKRLLRSRGKRTPQREKNFTLAP